MSSSAVTVTCTSATAKFEFNRVENVHISGVTLQGCASGAAMQMSTVTSATIRKCNFIQNNGNSLRTSNSVITVDKSKFYNNSYSSIHVSYSNISIRDSCFNDNDGNAIYTQYSSVIVDSSEFNYNDGSAILTGGSYKFQINNTIFYGNRATSGGAIYMTIQHGHGTYPRSLIQINNTTFLFNVANYQGGAIYLTNY